MGTWVSLLSVILLIWFWADSVLAKEKAVRVCSQACERQGVQLLDDTVALHRLRCARNRDGRMTWRRSYHFEYSRDGTLRLHGSVVLHGRHLELLTMDTPEGTIQIEHIASP